MSMFSADARKVLESSDSEEEGAKKSVRVVRNVSDLQRLKVEKLMRQPEKPVYIPEKRKERKMVEPPEFMRNAWGSSAGAGSGDFHVYRGVRRREYARQKFLTEKTDKDEKDTKYQAKLEENKKGAEERTSKKRAKRMRKKQNAKKKKELAPTQKSDLSSSPDEQSEEDKPE